jgi:hypothetical protein
MLSLSGAGRFRAGTPGGCVAMTEKRDNTIDKSMSTRVRKSMMAERPPPVPSPRDGRRDSGGNKLAVRLQTEEHLARLMRDTPLIEQRTEAFKRTIKLLKEEIKRLGGDGSRAVLKRTESTPTLPRLIAPKSLPVALASPPPLLVVPPPVLPLGTSAPSIGASGSMSARGSESGGSGIRIMSGTAQGGARGLQQIGKPSDNAAERVARHQQTLQRMMSTMNGPAIDQQIRITMNLAGNSFCKRGWRCWLRDGCGPMTGCNQNARYYEHWEPLKPEKRDTQDVWYCLMTFFDHCDRPAADVSQQPAYSCIHLQRIAWVWCSTQENLLPAGYTKRRAAFPRGLFMLAAAYRHYLRLELLEQEQGPDLPVYVSNDSLAMLQLRSKSMIPELLELEAYAQAQFKRVTTHPMIPVVAELAVDHLSLLP